MLWIRYAADMTVWREQQDSVGMRLREIEREEKTPPHPGWYEL
jgi:hypothetical protein